MARACGRRGELLHDTPNLNAIFGGCAWIINRQNPQLAKALGQRGIRVVHWAEADSSKRRARCSFRPGGLKVRAAARLRPQ